jgi:MFS family permease
VRRQAATGLISQLSQGAAAIGIILVVREHGGSLTLAGAVVGAVSIAAGVARPVQGRLIDSRGAAGVMTVCGIAHPAALIGIAGSSAVHGLGWRAGAPRRLLVLLGLLTACLALLVAAGSLVAAGALLLCAGAPLNPALTTLSLLVDRHVAAGSAAEAFGWLSTSLAGGTGAASVIAAALTQHHNPRAAFIVAAGAGAGATVLTAAARRSL